MENLCTCKKVPTKSLKVVGPSAFITSGAILQYCNTCFLIAFEVLTLCQILGYNVIFSEDNIH